MEALGQAGDLSSDFNGVTGTLKLDNNCHWRDRIVRNNYLFKKKYWLTACSKKMVPLTSPWRTQTALTVIFDVFECRRLSKYYFQSLLYSKVASWLLFADSPYDTCSAVCSERLQAKCRKLICRNDIFLSPLFFCQSTIYIQHSHTCKNLSSCDVCAMS